MSEPRSDPAHAGEAPARQLAERIARDLFTNGQGQRAERLVLTIDGPPTRDLGGWSECCFVDRVTDLLKAGPSVRAVPQAAQAGVVAAHPSDWLPIESFQADDEEWSDSVLVACEVGIVGEAVYRGKDGWWWVNCFPDGAPGPDRIYPTYWRPLPDSPVVIAPSSPPPALAGVQSDEIRINQGRCVECAGPLVWLAAWQGSACPRCAKAFEDVACEAALDTPDALAKALSAARAVVPSMRDHEHCHDLVCNGDRNHPRGATGVGCSCHSRALREARAVVPPEGLRTLVLEWAERLAVLSALDPPEDKKHGN